MRISFDLIGRNVSATEYEIHYVCWQWYVQLQIVLEGLVGLMCLFFCKERNALSREFCEVHTDLSDNSGY